MSNRGDYRSFFCAFWDDPDVHALSDNAYRVLTTLKGTLPASGIGVVYLAQLAERCAKSRAEVEAALIELAKPKADSSLGWIVRERNIVWVVNGLRFEPRMIPGNSKHRTYLRDRLIAPLGERTPIVVAFRRHYPDWFESDAVPCPEEPVNESSSEGYRNPIDTVSEHNSYSFSNPSPNQNQGNDDEEARAASTLTIEGLTSVTLSVWINTAIEERWGRQAHPKTPAQCEELRHSIRERRIEPSVARLSIYRQCRGLKQAKPPRTPNYFLGGIEDDWNELLAERAKAGSGEVPPAPRETERRQRQPVNPGEASYAAGRAALEDL